MIGKYKGLTRLSFPQHSLHIKQQKVAAGIRGSIRLPQNQVAGGKFFLPDQQGIHAELLHFVILPQLGGKPLRKRLQIFALERGRHAVG